VHQRLAADDAEEAVPHRLRLADEAVEGVGRDGLLLVGHVHPAALAAEVAGVDDGDVQERREHLAALEPQLVPVDGQGGAEAHVVGELPQEALVGLDEHPLGHLQEHGAPPGQIPRV
jgi:hypothetical protein